MINTKERLMYEIMKEIYEQNYPICFKGSMVLKAFLLETGYTESVRHTADIDANWNSEMLPSEATLVSALQSASDKAGIAADVQLYRMYGVGRSAGFSFTDRETGEELFLMDIDVNRPIPNSQLYEIEGFHFQGVSPTQMIADKISAVSSDKVFRRIKDVLDLYYLSQVFPLNKNEVLQTIQYNEQTLGSFTGFLGRKEELQHAYEKFRLGSDVYKPSFDEVYRTVKKFISELLPQPSPQKKREMEH